MDQEKFTYTIGGKKYVQRPLVLGQVNQLMAVLRGVDISSVFNAASVIAMLGSKIQRALAIVLHEETPLKPVGDDKFVYLRDRNLNELSDEIEFNIDPVTTLQVVEDFFDCNPMLLLLEKFAKLGETVVSRIEQVKTGLNKLPSSSPRETSPGATQ